VRPVARGWWLVAVARRRGLCAYGPWSALPIIFVGACGGPL